MGMDELEDAKGGQRQHEPSEPEPPTPPSEEEDKSARVDAAKAFFRAMYAGEEPPASFGQQPQAQQPDASTKTACRKCEGLELSLKESEQKQAEAETLYKRMAADFENYRRRMEREKEESISLGVKKAAEAMMPALDDLGRAMQFLSPDSPSDKLIDSFKIVGNRINQSMESVGLKKIIAIGEQFDPKYHEPVQQIETTEHVDGAVMNELRPGYILGDRVVRPSLVNVASNPNGSVITPAAPAEGAAVPAQDAPGEQVDVEVVDSLPEQLSQYENVDPSELEHTVATLSADIPKKVAESEDSTRIYDLEGTPEP